MHYLLPEGVESFKDDMFTVADMFKDKAVLIDDELTEEIFIVEEAKGVPRNEKLELAPDEEEELTVDGEELAIPEELTEEELDNEIGEEDRLTDEEID